MKNHLGALPARPRALPEPLLPVFPAAWLNVRETPWFMLSLSELPLRSTSADPGFVLVKSR